MPANIPTKNVIPKKKRGHIPIGNGIEELSLFPETVLKAGTIRNKSTLANARAMSQLIITDSLRNWKTSCNLLLPTTLSYAHFSSALKGLSSCKVHKIQCKQLPIRIKNAMADKIYTVFMSPLASISRPRLEWRWIGSQKAEASVY